MNQPAFDTHKTVKRLSENGFTEQQAETVTAVLVDISDRYQSSSATKADVETARKDLDTKLEANRIELKTDIKTLDAKVDTLRIDMDHKLEKLGMSLTIKLGGMIVLAVGILLAAIRYFPPAH
jgi:Protein of unknown function (DUF1640)